MNSELARRVIELRQGRGWSQRELGRRAGIRGATVSKLESGSVDPEANTVVRIALALDEDPKDLMRLAGKLPERPPPTPLDDQLLDAFHRLGVEQQNALVTLLRGPVQTRTAPNSPASAPAYAPRADPDLAAFRDRLQEHIIEIANVVLAIADVDTVDYLTQMLYARSERRKDSELNGTQELYPDDTPSSH